MVLVRSKTWRKYYETAFVQGLEVRRLLILSGEKPDPPILVYPPKMNGKWSPAATEIVRLADRRTHADHSRSQASQG